MKNEVLELFKRKASCLPDCWCELPRLDSFPVEPANSWSNISFLLVAFLIFRNFDIRKLETKMASISFIGLGLGSFFFHSTLSYVGQLFDVVGMYVLVSFFIYYLLNFWSSKNSQRRILEWVTLNIFMGVGIYYFPSIRRFLFAFLILFLLFLTQKNISKNDPKKDFYLSIVLLVSGILCWTLDRNKVFCIPDAWINLHCFWHFFVSFSGYYYFKFLSSLRGQS